MEVFEGQTFSLDDDDRRYIAEKVGGCLERREIGWAINRLVGHLYLPSGDTLRIRSAKATNASILSWLAYADPTLRSLRVIGRLPAATDVGDLAAVIARLFLRELLNAAARHGLMRRYARAQVRTSVVRGRIDFSRLARTGGDLSRIPCTVWERLPETPLNRFLAAAVSCVSHDKVMRDACTSELPQAFSLIGGVRPGVSPSLLSGRTPLPRNEQGFEAVCALARLILRNTALSEGSTHAGIAFLLNLETLFERTISRAFQEAGVHTLPQAPVRYSRLTSVNNPGAIGTGAMYMDVYCPDVAGGSVVVDAKYKTAVSSGILQQMVTYCFLTGARRGVLVFPAGHLQDRRSYRFAGGGHRDGDFVRIDLAELATDASDVPGWREAAKCLVASVLENTG